MPNDFISELRWRGLLHQHTEGALEHLQGGSRGVYCGFDPTAASLHVGNLVPALGLIRAAQAGHRAVALVGGGTAAIGDPSGKSAERPMLSRDEVDAQAARIDAQLNRLLANAGVQGTIATRNNAEWLGALTVLDFLRDAGKHFSINWMMQKDSVKSRLETGISFTEFSYMLLQAYDFQHLLRHHGVTVQIGGSDQFGNITAGTELIRRSGAGEAHGVTFPLLTTASGKKFGKSEQGAIYLDPALTSPYRFYQFWVNTDDADVEQALKTFTFMDEPSVTALAAEHAAAPHERAAQQRLAAEVTTLIHGAEATRQAQAASQVVFDKKRDLRADPPALFEMLEPELPSVRTSAVDGAVDVVAALADAFTLSRGAARKLIQQGGVSVNGAKLAADATTVAAADALHGRWLLLRKGQRDIALARLAD